MEPDRRAKLSIVVFGVIVPALILVAAYNYTLDRFGYLIFDKPVLRSDFARKVIGKKIGADYPPVDAIIMGDSTAKSNVDPREIKSVFSLNFGIHGGSNVISFSLLKNYLESHSAPGCVVLLGQQNWSPNYGHFFTKAVYMHVLSVSDFWKIWQDGNRNGIFPATDLSLPQYFYQGALHFLRMNDIPLVDMQSAIWSRSDRRMRKRMKWVVGMDESRGFNDKGMNVLPERSFVSDRIYAPYEKKFEPSRSEEFYLKEILRLSRERNFRVLMATTPAAQTPYLEKYRDFFRSRDDYAESLFKRFPELVRLEDLPKHYPRRLHYDLTHLGTEGAGIYSRELDVSLRKLCRPTRNANK